MNAPTDDKMAIHAGKPEMEKVIKQLLSIRKKLSVKGMNVAAMIKSLRHTLLEKHGKGKLVKNFDCYCYSSQRIKVED